MNGTNPEWVDFLVVMLALAPLNESDIDAVADTHSFITKNSGVVNGPLKGECDVKGRAIVAASTLDYLHGSNNAKPDWATNCGAEFDGEKWILE